MDKNTINKTTVIYFKQGQSDTLKKDMDSVGLNVKVVHPELSSLEYIREIESVASDLVVLVDGERMSLNAVEAALRRYSWTASRNGVGYEAVAKGKLWMGMIQNSWHADRDIISSPVLVGDKASFLKAYGGSDLAGNTLMSVAYSLQRAGGMKFRRLENTGTTRADVLEYNKWRLWGNYSFRLPARYLFSGEFFKQLLIGEGKVQRDMVFRMLLLCFFCFTFVFMTYISKDYGVTGDEFMDHRHSGYVLDYFTKGDKAALNQPRTVLHLYGNVVQVITGAICRGFNVENCYELRHFANAAIGALGVVFTGLMGLRWGGGLCGLLTALMMFFSPRFFGHSMNNLKDIPFAVGYMLSLFYTVRLFDYFPVFKFRHMLGLILGIALTLGTRSGGLVIYPMVFMYAGLFYILYCGIRNFYKFKTYANEVGRILEILIIVFVCSYILSILLWPYALQKPLSGMFQSLSQFTHYHIGLRTIFDGEQMMSNMLPWKYAPKYLLIGMPVVTLIGFMAYILYLPVRRKEFSLIAFFFLFAAIFPVFWVVYQHSNLYGGIRHLLFVMPPMVILAGRFWSEIIHWANRYFKFLIVIVFLALLSFPVSHMIKNHPNDYVYFNEFRGGLKNAYGDYETDYYFNSLKQSTDWFKKNVLPGLPKDSKTIIVTQAVDQVAYYFRRDTNIRVIYSRYYEKYSKDWDYAIFGNVYISQWQLKNGLFPPAGSLYAPVVDGYPMSFVLKRDTKQELEGFELEKEGKYKEALDVLNAYVSDHKDNEEVWSRIGKLYFLTNQYTESKAALDNALKLHPTLNEALYMTALVYIEMKDYNQAFNAVNRMLAENSSSADGWYLRALIFYHQKQYQNSINDLNRLLSFRPDFERAHLLAGEIFRDNENYQQAAKMFEKALKINPSINTLVQLADVAVRMKNFKEAEELLKKAIEVQPSFYPIYKVKLRMSLMQGNLPLAGEYLKKMGEIANDSELFVLGAMYYDRMNDKNAMRMMLDKALTIDSGNVEALKLKKQSE